MKRMIKPSRTALGIVRIRVLAIVKTQALAIAKMPVGVIAQMRALAGVAINPPAQAPAVVKIRAPAVVKNPARAIVQSRHLAVAAPAGNEHWPPAPGTLSSFQRRILHRITILGSHTIMSPSCAGGKQQPTG